MGSLSNLESDAQTAYIFSNDHPLARGAAGRLTDAAGAELQIRSWRVCSASASQLFDIWIMVLCLFLEALAPGNSNIRARGLRAAETQLLVPVLVPLPLFLLLSPTVLQLCCYHCYDHSKQGRKPLR